MPEIYTKTRTHLECHTELSSHSLQSHHLLSVTIWVQLTTNERTHGGHWICVRAQIQPPWINGDRLLYWLLTCCQTLESGRQIHICWYFRWGCMVTYAVEAGMTCVADCNYHVRFQRGGATKQNNGVKNHLDLHQVQKRHNLIMLIAFRWLTSVNALATPLEAFFNISLQTHTTHTDTQKWSHCFTPAHAHMREIR